MSTHLPVSHTKSGDSKGTSEKFKSVRKLDSRKGTQECHSGKFQIYKA